MDKIAILDQIQIEQKIKRMAYEVWEKNSAAKELYFVGIADMGSILAKQLADVVSEISNIKIHIQELHINKQKPWETEVVTTSTIPKNKTIILVDDVANSGKTLIYALPKLLEFQPSKIQIAVLVDRKHKSYPITPDIIGNSVSTTLQDDIRVSVDNGKIVAAFLQ
jgi:pyrimidine operon attenuation protein/uracil phosphoribosyltransferase